MYCLWLFLHYDSRVEDFWERDYVAHKAKNIYNLAFYRKFFIKSLLTPALENEEESGVFLLFLRANLLPWDFPGPHMGCTLDILSVYQFDPSAYRVWEITPNAGVLMDPEHIHLVICTSTSTACHLIGAQWMFSGRAGGRRTINLFGLPCSTRSLKHFFNHMHQENFFYSCIWNSSF